MRDMEIGVVMIVVVALMVCCFSLLTNVVGRGAEVYQCQGFARVLNNPKNKWTLQNKEPCSILKKTKTYNSRDSLVVTDPTTNLPV
jgi:hypothetical protein